MGNVVQCYHDNDQAYLGSETVCGQNVFVLSARRTPGVIQLKTLITEIGPAVRAAFSGLQCLRWLAELTHHCQTAQTHCLSVPIHTHAQLDILDIIDLIFFIQYSHVYEADQSSFPRVCLLIHIYIYICSASHPFSKQMGFSQTQHFLCKCSYTWSKTYNQLDEAESK